MKRGFGFVVGGLVCFGVVASAAALSRGCGWSMSGSVLGRVAGAGTAVPTRAPAAAFAQGGGASTTGSINGRVTDTSNAVLPGVTVNATSPSAMGIQTSVTDGGGNYRFPALPPGTYTLSFELPGFNTLKRENI